MTATPVEYLVAKRAVDDAALHRPTLERFVDSLPDAPHLLEVGGGVGTMVERLVEEGRLPPETAYTLLDEDPALVETARDRLAARGDRHDTQVVVGGVTVDFVASEALSYARTIDRRFDAVVACAVLDLLAVEPALAALGRVAPGGLLYAPITFDGVTVFTPPHPDDTRVLDRYHEHMDAHREGSSTGGRELVTALSKRDAILSVGGSDWVVIPPYGDDERRFVAHIAETVAGTVASLGLDADDWATVRREQARTGTLGYLAHNLDVLGRLPDGSTADDR